MLSHPVHVVFAVACTRALRFVYEEVKAFRNPPRMVVSCLTVVLALVGSSKLIGHCQEILRLPAVFVRFAWVDLLSCWSR